MRPKEGEIQTRYVSIRLKHTQHEPGIPEIPRQPNQGGTNPGKDPTKS